MIKKLDLKDIETAEKILDLQIASYRIEAELIGFYEIPPLKDTIESLRACEEIFYGYYSNDALAGIISFKVIDSCLDIHRVAVHPLFFRRGVANKLINFVENLDYEINKIVVSTGKENLPAVKLYIRNGYKKKEDIEISKGIYIMCFEKVL
jgi:ribosomal protein S18 acetylase RimI-like enzyme